MPQSVRMISHRLLLSPILLLLSLCSPSLGQGVYQRLGRERRAVVKNRVLHGILASARELGVTEPVSRSRSNLPVNCATGKSAEFRLQRLLRLSGHRRRKFKNIIESAEQGVIEHLRMV